MPRSLNSAAAGDNTVWPGRIGLLFCALLIALSRSAPAAAIEIQQVTSAAGIKALLVEDYTVPLLAVSFSFRSGAAQDPVGKEGTAFLLSALLDEGAGELDSQAFQAKLDELGVELSFHADRDFFSGTMRTLTDSADEAFRLLALALQRPRFDAAAVARMRALLATGLRRAETQPNAVGRQAWDASLFAGHAYGRPMRGTVASLSALVAGDVRNWHRRNLARANLVVAVVGAIDAATLAERLDEVFAALPATAEQTPVADVEPTIGERRRIALAVPQASIFMGLKGVRRDHPDFYAVSLMNHILGGGAFSSRLYREVREQRGLAYGVYTVPLSWQHSSAILATAATRADRVAETIKILRSEIARMAREGVTAEELENARRYVLGAYAIKYLDSSSNIAATLVTIQAQQLGDDYIERRAAHFGAVRLADIKRVAAQLLAAGPTVIVVGPTADKP